MKKCTQVLFLVLVFASATQLFSQCPGCIINSSCLPPTGGLCPDSVPAATVAVAYNEDVTFYLPPQVDAPPLGMVDLLEVHIDAVAGLPFGINWTADQPSNTYILNGNGGHGCVKLCGTPIGTPGVYNITVTVTATVDAGIFGNQQGQQNFYMQMVLLPGSSSNAGFTLTPPLGCEPLIVSYTNNNSSGGYVSPNAAHYGGFIYSWDFGNGNQSNVENPSPILYNTAGNYPVTYTLIVDTFGFVLKQVSVLTGPCTDTFSDPDYSMVVSNSSSTVIYNGAEISDHLPTPGSPCTWNMNLPINPSNWTFSASFTDEDSGLEGGDDGCGTVNFTLPPVNSYGVTTQTVTSGGLLIEYKIEKVVLTITGTDTIVVNPLPPVTPLVASATAVCSGDSILLTTLPGYSYEWFLNDTTALAGNTNQYWAMVPGSYSVKLIDPLTGCFSMMPDTLLTFYPAIPGSFAITLNSGQGQLQSSVTGAGYFYQWQFWNGSTWVNISAPAGVQNFYSPTGNGDFRLIINTINNCTDTAVYTLATFGLEDENVISQLSLYPNPASNSFTLDLQDVQGDQVTVSIINMVGQTVYQKYFEVSGGQLNHQFDISQLANGVYTVDVHVGNFAIRKKLIKE